MPRPKLGLPPTAYRLTSDGRHSNKVQAWTNPAFDTTGELGKQGPGKQDAAITIQPAGGADLIESLFPNYRKLLRRMRYQCYAVYAFVVAHAMVIGYTDPIYTRTPLITVIVYGGQVGLLLAIVMAFFVLTSQTLFIQLGRYDLYLREFRAIYGLFLAQLALYVAIKVYATWLLYQRLSHLAFWDAPGYFALWAVQRVVLVFFWIAACRSATAVFNIRYFDPEHLFGMDEQRKRDKGQKRGSSSAVAPLGGGDSGNGSGRR